MPISSALLLALATWQPTPETKSFITSDQLLEMRIPKSWAVSEEKTRQVITFPTKAGKAVISVFAVKYLQTAEDWQGMQKTVNEQMKRVVVRQWEEEIMSVPMLLTTLRYTESKAGEVGVLIGLLYSNTSDKFQFRLEVPSAGFEEAETGWREALLTMRTSSGKLPTAEDGNPDSVAPIKPVSPGTTLSLSSQQGRVKPLGPVKVPFTVSGRTGVLRLPKGAQVVSESPLKVKWTNLEGEVAAEVMSADDSPASGLFLMQEVNKDLARFKSVTTRENVGPKRNDVGGQIFSTTRVGTTESGDLQTFMAVVDAGRFYVIFKYESTEAKNFKRQRDALMKLVDLTGFEVNP